MKISTRLTALLLALLMLLSIIATAETAYDPGSMTPEQWQALVENAQKELFTVDEGGVPVPTAPPADPVITDYHPYTDAVSAALGMGEEPVSLTMPASGVAVLTCSAQGQWQMELDGMWVAISGADASELWVSAAMMNGLSTANFRKALADGACTQTASVTLTADQPTALTAQPKASVEEASAPVLGQSSRATDPYDLDAANAGLTRYIIQINYLIANGEGKEDTQAASPRIYQIGENSAMNYTFDLPAITGYAPDTSATNLPNGFSISDDGKAFHIELASVTENITVNVYYEPIEVTYTVKYYKQNADDDDYTLDEGATLIREGKTGSTIKSNYPAGSADQYFATLKADAYEGFLPLIYNDTVTIAADGSTVVPVYFVRLYYLLGLKLQGGTGAEPVYAKYGSTITVTNPTRAGYTFAGWATTESGKDDNGNSTITPLPSTMPYGGATYYAQWTPVETTFRLVYWLENADDEKYSVFGTTTISKTSGTTVQGLTYQNYADYGIVPDSNFIGEKRMTINNEKTDKDIVIEGDGSTTVNVYFDRKEYTLRFYYAMRGNNTNYVVTGNTRYFGEENGSNSDSDLTQLELYWGEVAGKEKKVVSSIPAFTDQAAQIFKPLQLTHNNHTYYYFEYTAKFGADFTGIWPYDVFGQITVNGDVAYLAGWNGESMVTYSQNNKNETIKGFYNKLDENLMWLNEDPKDGIISFLAYWETNEALYRYKVWLPLLSGQSQTDLTTKTHNNVTYYLFDSYDTIDKNKDENLQQQTVPVVNGYTHIETVSEEILDTDYPRAWDFNYYYRANNYSLTLINADGKVISSISLPVGTNISTNGEIPPFPTNLTVGSATFEGWYTSSVFTPGTKFDFTGATMPAANLILYANWTPNTYTVRAYVTKAEAEAAKESEEKGTPWVSFKNVKHGDATSSVFAYDENNNNHYNSGEFEMPTNGEWTFTHWYYIKDGEEKIFDFTSTPITADTYVYAGWRADKIVKYTIYYVKEGTTTDYLNNDNWVADPTTGSDLAGHSVTVEAAQGSSSLYEAYASGYFPTVQSASFTLDVDEKNNVYVFKYTQEETVPYTVYHLTTDVVNTNLDTILIDRDGDGTKEMYYQLTAPVTYDQNDKAVVTENYISVGNYIPDAFQKRLVVSTNVDDNVIIFFYTKDEKQATLQINHYLLPHGDQSTPVLHASSETIVSLPHVATITAETIANYTYYHAERSDGGGDFYTTSVLSFTMAENSPGVVINLYYKEQTVTLNYVVANASAGYGTVSPASETFGAATGTPGGSTATANPGHHFVGWYSDAECTLLVGPDAAFVPTDWKNGDTFYARFELSAANLVIKKVVKDADYTAAPASDTFTIQVALTGNGVANSYSYTSVSAQGVSSSGTLNKAEGGTFTIPDVKAGDVITIQGISIGTTFTVTETDNTSYSEDIEPKSGTIAAAGNNVTVTNTYLTGTLTISKTATGGNSDESFIFSVSGPNGYSGRVSIKGSGSITLTNLPLGEYTVTETSWSYRYSVEGNATRTTTLSKSKLTDTLTFSNNRTNDKWLHDEDSKHNDFSTNPN